MDKTDKTEKCIDHLPRLNDNFGLWALEMGQSFTKTLGEKIHRSVFQNSIGSVLFSLFCLGVCIYGILRLQTFGLHDVWAWVLSLGFGLISAVMILVTFCLVHFLKAYKRNGFEKEISFPGPWTKTSSPSLGKHHALVKMGLCILLALFMLPFCLMTDFSFIPLFFIAFNAAVLIFSLLFYVRARHFGSSHIEYSQFPLKTGVPIQLLFSLPANATSARSLRAILRYIEERQEREDLPGRRFSESPGMSKHWVTRAYELRQMSQEIHLVPGQEKIPIMCQFPLGEKTELFSKRYWLLEIQIERPGLDFKDYYLLPVAA